jgi:hypothetical protein
MEVLVFWGAVGLGLLAALTAARVATSPSVGSGEVGSAIHPPAVEDGHGLGVTDTAEYADKATRLGLRAAHCDLRLENSVGTGVGVP